MVRLIEVQGAVELLEDHYFELSTARRYDEPTSLLVQRVIRGNAGP